MYYSMTIAGLKRDLPICPVNENLSIAGFVIFGDQELTVACARELLKKAPEYDYIITAEAKGIPLAHEMARQADDAKYFVARKGSKLYMRDTFGVAVRSITTDREQHLYLDGQDAKLIKGKRILILDDVISTGESLSALEALVEKAGGIVFGAPVHYATAAGSMLGFMHRLAYSAGRYLRHKPAAIVTSARRAGTTTAIEAMEKIPQFYEMPLVSSTYWPMVHGTSGDQVALDEEGCQIMRNLGTNMAWLLKCIEAGKAAGVEVPTAEGGKRTNFIR